MSKSSAVRPLTTESQPNDLDAFWMPFTSNRSFKKAPRIVSRSKDMYLYTNDGKAIMDTTAGLWCCNAGHNREPIVEAIKAQAETLDYSPPFQFAHPLSFQLASRIASMAPGDLDHVFFTNSGSEAVDTALKMALGYWHAKGESNRCRFIGRERGYHGIGFGGISVGGMLANRKAFATQLLPHVDHLPHTYNRSEQAFTKGEPEWGAHLADQLENIVALHDASTIAAVIVEPMAGSTGVLPPPKGYLKRLRAICDKYGILLIFDEVITGFGRLGANFASERFDVIPDMFTFAKGVTSGTVPMGGVVARSHIHDAFMKGPEHMIEFFHGYTYSAHPLACAAAMATLDVYRDENLFARARSIEPYWEEAMHSLKGMPNVLDIRTMGLTAAFDLASIPDAFGKRAYTAMHRGFEDYGFMVRQSGETLALTPPLIISKEQIDEVAGKMKQVLNSVA